MSIAFATLTTQFLERPGLSQNTIRSYESALLPLLQKWGALPLNSLTRQMVEDYFNSLTHLSYVTHNRHQTITQSVFNTALPKSHI